MNNINLGIIDMDDIPSEEDTSKLPAATQNLTLSADLEKEGILEAGINLGRVEALDFVATVANYTLIEIFESVKKSKAWKYLRNCDGRAFESLEEFCEVKLGKSYRRIQELSANRKLIGEAAFEQAEKIGLRQSDFRAIKALPPNQQEIVRKALEDGADLETVKSALHRVIEEDQYEIDSLTQKVNSLQKRVSAQDAELELKSKSIAKLQNRRRTTDFTQETEDVRAECLALQAECELPINSLEKLFEEHVNSSEKEYWERMGQIWITVNVVCARAVDLSTRMKDLLGEDNLPKRIQTEHTMLPDEAERWILDYRRIVNDHENARYERQRKREEAAPRGRGRPRKIAQ